MPKRDPLYWTRDLDDPPRNGRAELTFVADATLPSGLLYCSLFVDRYAAREELRSKRAACASSYYVSAGSRRLLVRATFPGSLLRIESNVLFVVAQAEEHHTINLSFTGQSLVLQSAA